jgi:hypothetical protein
MASSVKNQASDATSHATAQADAGAPPAQETGEEEILALIRSASVTAEDLSRLARISQAPKSRKILVALAVHPRTPRHISIPLLRRMFTFDLMQLTLTPAVAADIKRAGEEQILVRAESLSRGEKISLARRASGRIAAELLREADEHVVSVALDNGRLVEAGVVTALMDAHSAELLFHLVSAHAKWSQRREVQIALLRSEKTPLEKAQEFANHFSPELLTEIVPPPRVADLIH